MKHFWSTKTYLYFILFAIKVLPIVCTSKKPAISAFSFPSSLTAGMRVIITCSILEGDYPIQLRWLFNDRPIDATFMDVEENSMGYMGSSLLFRKVDRKHNGDYSCVASNKAGNITHTARMIVKVPPVWKIEPTDQSVVIGKTVRFDCQADGFPPPVIRWKVSTGTHKNEFKSVSSNYHIQCLENGSLVIKEADKSDEGLYVCEAGNQVAADISIVVKLSVHIGAHFKKNFQVIRVTKGNTIRVMCEVLGEKPLYVKWIRDRNDIDLISDKKYTITERHTNDGLISELMCSSAERIDSTHFGCIAWNLYGQSEMNSQVLVEEVPDPPNDVLVVDVSSRSVTLKWSTPFAGNNPISKYIIEWKRENEQWNLKSYEIKGETQLTVTNLNPLTKYYFRVYAINGIGKSDFSEIIATTHEEIPSKPPNDVKVVPLSSKSLKISWMPPNEPYGSVKGYYIGYKALNSDKAITFKTVDFTINKDMEFILSSLQKSTKYMITVQAFNSKGAGPQSHEIWSETFDSDPPKAPKLKILDSSDSTSVTFSWIIDEENPIRGFRLIMRIVPEEWQQHQHIIDGKSRKYKLSGLKCATNYQFYIIAFNDVGQSPASDMVSHFTNGKVPQMPEKEALISLINSTSITLELSSWNTIGCAINYFVVQYKQYKQNEWILVQDNVIPENQLLIINGLKPANWYHMLMSAHTDIGITDAEYVFSTLTPIGATIAPIYGLMSEERNGVKKIIVILIPIACAITVLFVITFVVIYMFCSTKTTSNAANSDTNDWKRESMSMTAMVKSGLETTASSDQFYGNNTRIASRDDHSYEIPFAKRPEPNDYETVIRRDDLHADCRELNHTNFDKQLSHEECVNSLLNEEKHGCVHSRCEDALAFALVGAHSHLCANQFNACIH